MTTSSSTGSLSTSLAGSIIAAGLGRFFLADRGFFAGLVAAKNASGEMFTRFGVPGVGGGVGWRPVSSGESYAGSAVGCGAAFLAC